LARIWDEDDFEEDPAPELNGETDWQFPDTRESA
jgi:hypothetical protein